MKKPWWKDREELVDMLLDTTIVVTVIFAVYALATVAIFFIGREL